MRSDFAQQIGELAKRSFATQAKKNAKQARKKARKKAEKARNVAVRKAAFERSPEGLLQRLERAFDAAPVGSIAKAQAGQVLTVQRLRKAAGGGDIPLDQAEIIRQATVEAEAAALSGKSKPSAKDQIAAMVDGTAQRMSLAGRADPQAVAQQTSRGAAGAGLVKSLEEKFARARAEGGANEIARAGEELTRAKLRLAHGG